MFHHTRGAIEAHLTIVFTALAIARHLQDATGMSIKKIVQTLRPLQQVTLTIAGHEHTAADPLTAAAREILDATGTIGRHTKTARLGLQGDDEQDGVVRSTGVRALVVEDGGAALSARKCPQ